MRSEHEMEKIIQREKVLARKRQIEHFKETVIGTKYAIGIPFATDKERIEYHTENGRNYLRSKIV